MTTKMTTRLPSLSPTKIVTYLACDHKYKWTYVDSRGKWFIRSKSYFSFGTSLHSVLQKLHDQNDISVVNAEDAVNALESNWVTEGYASADEMAEAQARGKEILLEYVDREVTRQKESRTLFVEKTLVWKFPNFVLRGRLDRIEEYPDGSLEIIDYKSGRETVLEEEVHNDLAMAIYQLLLQKAYPDRDVRCTIIALKSGHNATSKLTDDEMADFAFQIELLGNEIIGTDFDLRRPSPKPLCERCDFLSLCKKEPDFAENFRHYQDQQTGIEED